MGDKQKEYNYDALEKSLAKDLLVLDTAIKASRMVLDLHEDETTFNFNSLDVLKVGEIHLTRALAWFLDPHESHRQKDLFLNAFLKECCNITSKADLGKFVYISAEEAIEEHGQLDIIIEFEEYSIIIENKIWGKDDPGQLDKYIEWCEERGKDYLLLFLTMDDQGIANSKRWGQEKNIHTQLTYKKDIHGLLKGFRGKCLAQKVRKFISEILQWIEFNVKVPGGRDVMSEGKVLEKLITEDWHKFEMLWKVTNAFDFNKYLEEAVCETRKLLKEKIKEKFSDRYTIDDSNDNALLSRNTNQGWISLEKITANKEFPRRCYSIESYSWTEGVYVGISKDESKVSISNEQKILEKIEKVCAAIEGKFDQENKLTDWWIGIFFPPLIAGWDTDQYESQMAWHIANPEERIKLVENIVYALEKLIQATKGLVE